VQRCPALAQRIEAAQHLLATQGSLVRKWRRGCEYTYLRYFAPSEVEGCDQRGGGRIQRSIYIGHDRETIRLVELWLQELRADRAELRQLNELAVLAERVARAVRRLGPRCLGTRGRAGLHRPLGGRPLGGAGA
jgi:hypothetical protein